MLSSFRLQMLIAGLALLLTLSARLALDERYALERRNIEAAVRKQRTLEIARSWNRFPFFEAGTRRLGDGLVGAIYWPRVPLTPAQKASLKDRLREIVSYLQDPSLDEYYRLKTEGLAWKFELSGHACKRLGRTELLADGAADRQPLDMVSALWEGICAQNRTGSPARLVAACLEGVAIATSQTNSASDILKGPVAKGFTIAQEATEPGFTYEAEDRSSSTGRASALFVHLSFLARSSVSDDAGPMYISLSWSDAAQNWVLSKLLTDDLLKMNMLF